MIQLRQDERGSLTLITEALLMAIFGVVAFLAMKAVLMRADEQSAATKALIQCDNVLDCPGLKRSTAAPVAQP